MAAAEAPAAGEGAFHRMPGSVRVELVSTEDAAVRLSRAAKEAFAVGIDAEWRPPLGRGGKVQPAALLQLALRGSKGGGGDDTVYLLDMSGSPHLAAQFRSILQDLLRDKEVVKLGFGLAGDLQAASRALGPDAEGSVAITDPYVDVRELPTGRDSGAGLSRLVEAALGRPLDKGQQCSDWEARPLSREQLDYASTDAHCLLSVLDTVVATGRGGGEDLGAAGGGRVGAGAGREEVAEAGRRWGRRLDLNDLRRPAKSKNGGGGKGSGKNGLQEGGPVYPAPPPFAPGEPALFLGDVMTLGLCKQLRMCGIDTECEDGPGGQKSYQRLVSRAEREGRIILTGDTRFMQGRYTERAYFVRSRGKVKQLQEVLAALRVDVEGAKLMSRCVHCNGDLEIDQRPPEELREFAGVPQHVLDDHAGEIWGCVRCAHVYWPGVLYRRALSELGGRVSGVEERLAKEDIMPAGGGEPP